MTKGDLARTYAAGNRDTVVNGPSAEYAIYKVYLQGWHDCQNHTANDNLSAKYC